MQDRMYQRRGRPEAVLNSRSLQSIADGALDEWRQRLQACVVEKEYFERLL